MKKRIKNYIFIIIIAFIVSIPLFKSDFNIYYDDGVQHICRLMGTYQSLITENQTFPVIMSNFCNGFGYSWNLFYSPLTAYVPLLFRIFTDSYCLCLKAFIVLVTILSGISMYEFIYKVTKNKYAGILASAIYMLAPYRLTDMYIRMAIAELTSFIFLPMIFQGVYTIFSEDEENEEKTGLLLTVGAVGLILTHTIMAMYTAIFGLFYVIINIKKLKKKEVLKKLIINLVLIICITSFFWAPMLEHKLNTEYEVFKEGRMERTDVLVSYKLNLIDFIYTDSGSMSYEIGLVTLIGLMLTILAFKKIDKRYKKLYVFSLISGIVSILMTLKWFPFEKLPSILKMMQFPFRMLEFSTFFFAIIASINYSVLIKNFKMKDVVILSIIAILLVVPLKKNLKYTEFDENTLWPAVPVTENTKRVHAGCASFEYLPSKAFNNLEYIKTRENRVYVISGKADIQNEQKDGTNMEITLSEIEPQTVLELPYIYYLGYEVTFQNNSETINLKTYESTNGFIEIHLENVTEGKITVKYTGTNIMKISMVVSILAFTIMIIYEVFIKKQKFLIFD